MCYLSCTAPFICLNIVPAVGISAVQKQQEKLQNGVQLPGCDIAQNSDLGGAEIGSCGIKAIITQRKPQGLGGFWETLPRILCKLMLLLSGTRPAGNFNSLISLCSSSFLSIHLIVMLFS